MNHLGMTAEERFSVYTIVASVLHLGNIGFEDNQEDTKGIVAGNQGSLKAYNIPCPSCVPVCDKNTMRNCTFSKLGSVQRCHCLRWGLDQNLVITDLQRSRENNQKQNMQTEWQPSYSLISAPRGIWFVCTMFLHILLSKNLGFSKSSVFFLCTRLSILARTYNVCRSKRVSILLDYRERVLF